MDWFADKALNYQNLIKILMSSREKEHYLLERLKISLSKVKTVNKRVSAAGSFSRLLFDYDWFSRIIQSTTKLAMTRLVLVFYHPFLSTFYLKD